MLAAQVLIFFELRNWFNDLQMDQIHFFYKYLD